jgi:hypothetical protein
MKGLAVLCAVVMAALLIIPPAAPAQQPAPETQGISGLGWSVGDAWTWRMPEGVKVTWTVTTANGLGYTVDQTRDGTCCDVPLVQHAQIVIHAGVLDDTPTFGPGYPSLRLVFPISEGARTTRTMGGSETIHNPYGYAVGYRPQGGPWQTDWTIAGIEHVTVPAGTFDAYRIDGAQRNFRGGVGGQITVWYAPAVHNIVRIRWGTQPYWAEDVRGKTEDLISYRPAGWQTPPSQ